MKPETKAWIEIAREDFESAKVLIKKKLYRTVCFHCQQAVEKVLKAYLVEGGVKFKRVHDLVDLKTGIERLGRKVSLTLEDAAFLNSVYRSRYPADAGLLPHGEPKLADARRALKIAGKVFRWLIKLPHSR